MDTIYYYGAWRNESDSIWSDDWNFADEVAYREMNGYSMVYDRNDEREEMA